MEDENTEESIDSDSSDSFIESDDDYEDDLDWDSEDSRPPGPSPPLSANMTESPPIPQNARLLRSRARRARRIASNDTLSFEDDLPNPPSPNATMDQDLISLSGDSDETYMSATPTESQYSSNSFILSSNSTDHNPHSPVPNSHPSSPSDSPSTSVYGPISPSYSPFAPPRSPLRSPINLDHSENVLPSTNQGASPINEVVLLNNEIVLPNNERNQPINEVHLPSNVEALPSNEVALPSNEVALPSNEVTLPSNEGALTSNEGALPNNEVALPSNELAPTTGSHITTAPLPFNSSLLSESDDGSVCPICMDPLTNSGKHRVVCLRCGHIFGQSCVERWIKVGCSNGAKRCPTCNKKACLKDIRILYLPKVVPLDTIERDRLIEEKEELVAKKTAVEMELSRCRLQNDLNIKKYEGKIAHLEARLVEVTTTNQSRNLGKMIDKNCLNKRTDDVQVQLLHTVDISKEGGCRVLAFNPLLQELVVSQPSGNTVFAGFGVRVLNTIDFVPTRFVYLHQKMIRDLAFHAIDRDLLLSASLDQTAKLVDLASSTVVHTFKGEGPLWSCCWDAYNPHLMLVGSQMGKIIQYDRRMMDHHVNLWEEKNNLTPVVALASAPCIASSPFPQGGFLSCRLNGVFAYIRLGEKYESRELDVEGPFMAMKYDYSAQSLLTTSRPSSRCPFTRVNLNQLDVDEEGNICTPQIHTFACGSSARVMSRMTTMPALNDTFVVAHDESGRTLNLWSSKTGNLLHSFPIKEPAIDLTSLTLTNNECLLASLSEKKIGIYKVT